MFMIHINKSKETHKKTKRHSKALHFLVGYMFNIYSLFRFELIEIGNSYNG